MGVNVALKGDNVTRNIVRHLDMGTIDTMRIQDQSLQIGHDQYTDMESVPFRVWITVLKTMIIAKAEKRRTRRGLGNLTARELRDIGITEADADHEIRKSFPLYVRQP